MPATMEPISAAAMPRSELRVHAGRLFTGEGALAEDRVVAVGDGRVRGISPGGARDADLSAPVVAPGFVDLQINGGGGRMLRSDPSRETLIAMRDAARGGGTTHILPTFITAPGEAHRRAVAAVEAALEDGVPGVLGLHLEGPFLSPDKPGIHPPGAIRPPTEEDLAHLCRPRPGAWAITLAPERTGPEAIARLTAAGWRVFAGHSAAAFEDLGPAIEAGLAGVTHLFNAMSPLEGRAPGLVGAALHHRLRAGIIADGVHVHPANVALARRALGDRLFLVTDAMATLGCEADGFELGGRRITLREGRLADAEGRLAGAHLAMDEAVANLVRWGAAALPEALAMATSGPAAALGRPDLGALRPGGPAHLALLGDDLRATGTLTAGVPTIGTRAA